MKVAIISGSVKDAKNSDTKAWSDIMALKLKANDIEVDVINLKDYDYEATTEGDILLEQMSKLYDANIILFAGPSFHCLLPFTMYNIFNRFKNAYKKGMTNGLNIFEKKYFDLCFLFSSEWDYAGHKEKININKFDKKHGITYHKPRKKIHDPYTGRQHNLVYDLLGFMNPIGGNMLTVCLEAPLNEHGPTRDQMATDKKINEDIERFIEIAKQKCVEDPTPNCSREEFTSFFEDTNAEFGRGMTLKPENINRDNVIKNIDYVSRNKNLEVINHAQIMLCMKERSEKAGKYDLSNYYFRALYNLIEKKGFRSQDAGTHRSNNY